MAGSDRAWVRGPTDAVRSRLAGELERLEGATQVGALGLGASASSDDIRAAFLEATKTFHPARFARRPKDVQTLANEVFLRLKAAYEATRDGAQPTAAAATEAPPSSPPKPADKPATRVPRSVPRPAVGRRSGKTSTLQRERLLSKLAGNGVATRRLKRAPTDEERAAELEIQFEAAKAVCAQGRFSEAREQFRELAIAKTSDKRFRVHMHYAWGRQWQADGDLDNAKAELQRALNLDANFAPAQSALESLTNRKSRNTGGLFKKLFGKDG